MMPQGRAAMILQGPWNIPIQGWPKILDFNFNVSSQPIMEEGLMVPLMVSSGGANQLYVYAEASDAGKAIAGDIFHYMGTLAGQQAWGKRARRRGGWPHLPEAEGADLDPIALARFADVQRTEDPRRPQPAGAQPDVVQVMMNSACHPEPGRDGAGSLHRPTHRHRRIAARSQ
ncbi:MAG: hypothetical protein R2856_36550 [Caldilineaceae bacterium]